MAEILVTPQQLKDKATTLESLNRSFRQEVEKMVGYEKELSTMYEGDAQKAFHTAFTNDQTKMETFAQNIDTYVQALRDTADVYDQAEAKATDIATKRN